MRVRFSTRSLLTAAVTGIATDSVTSVQKDVPILASVESSDPVFSLDREFDANEVADVTVAVEERTWSAQREHRFETLSRAEALGQISDEALQELEDMTRTRRHEKYPRSADEILWTRKQKALTRGLVGALQAYVEFHKTPRGSETLPEKANR